MDDSKLLPATMPCPGQSTPTASHAYLIGMNTSHDVLVDWGSAIRYTVLTPAEAIAFAGHLKRTAQLAIVAKKRAKQAERESVGGATIDKP